MPTSREIDILSHSIGWPQNYRNYYAAGQDDVPTCNSLVKQGLMIKRPGGVSWSGYSIYHVTETGKEAVAAFNHRLHSTGNSSGGA